MDAWRRLCQFRAEHSLHWTPEHMTRKSILLTAVFTFPLLAACAQEKSPADMVDLTDRAAVEQIVREYIIANPEVIEEALVELSRRERAETAAKLASDPRDYSIGPEDAKVTIVEFFDYRCGFCKRSMDWLLDQHDENPEDVRIVFKEFPILSRESQVAALAALAAGRQGKYNEMHQALMASRSDFSDEAIDNVARGIGVDVTKMRKDMEDEELIAQLGDIRNEAITLGAEATPTFFINGRVVSGWDQRTLDSMVKEELAR